ncbi:MAG: hypothetical protein ACYC8T_14420 [Myxococcaceae bacterium]
MRLFDPHLDETRLSALALGSGSGWRRRRLLAHARACPCCAQAYERVLLATRVLEGCALDEAAPGELRDLESAGLSAALRSAAGPAPAPRVRRWAALSALAAAAAASVLFFAKPEPEWAARGGAALPAELRVFCAVPGQPLSELREEGRCRAGSKLAFAAGAKPPLAHLALAIQGQGGQLLLGPFIAPDLAAPAALDATPVLSLQPGPATVIGAFAESPQAAMEAARGGSAPGAVVLRRTLRIDP